MDPTQIARARAQLAQLRTAINDRSHWVIGTDDRRAGFALRALAALLVLRGAGESEVLFAESDVRERRRGVHIFIPIAITAVAKSVLPADEVATFVAALSGHSSRPLATALQGGCDVLPIGSDLELLGRCLDGIRLGTCHAHDTAAN